MNFQADTHMVQWDKVKFMVFDSPQPDIIPKPYLERFEILKSVLQNHGIFKKVLIYIQMFIYSNITF